ncbi:DUF397 domain-containing protein [Qaidamihabitans albus]|uniref:DUF397 domain-containing protein n=1 Tax=Qaidamihabitans albus TaxID=2795733 RepID=UPI0018F137BA|nr:DUF397 domain-containing protein [Qaidamihabitans albus]
MSDERRSAVDDKAHIRDELDLDSAEWRRVPPEGNVIEYAFVPHTDGLTYVAIRSQSDPDTAALVFTSTEWDAFIAGARDGEFDQP